MRGQQRYSKDYGIDSMMKGVCLRMYYKTSDVKNLDPQFLHKNERTVVPRGVSSYQGAKR